MIPIIRYPTFFLILIDYFARFVFVVIITTSSFSFYSISPSYFLVTYLSSLQLQTNPPFFFSYPALHIYYKNPPHYSSIIFSLSPHFYRNFHLPCFRSLCFLLCPHYSLLTNIKAPILSQLYTSLL